jgi:hypothetical protein
MTDPVVPIVPGPDAVPPVVPAKPKEEKVPAVAAKTEGEKTTPTEPKRVRISDADDEIPADADLIEMSSKALKTRLNAAKKSEVRELFTKFGVKNADELDAKFKRLKELETADETRKREEMSATEKLEADLKQERKLRVDADQRALRVTENYVIDKQESRISKIAAKHIDPDYVEEILPKFAVHLRKNFDEEQLKTIGDKDIEDWFKEYATKKPKLAREHNSKPRVPLTNGARTEGRSQAGDGGGTQSGKANGRSFAPSAENAMSRQDARVEAAKLGYRW